ncbi:pentapeptide repeat-containing protein [Rothia dentocariosa]
MAETPRNNEETNATNPVGKTENFVSKHFVRLLVWLAVSGGALAIFGPWLLYVAGWTGETDANLRLHILYVTGGTIAVLGLVETHRKNTTDRIKAEADIQNYQASQSHQSKTLDEQARQFTETIAKEREKIEADKAKNEQDHIRQVHAGRRSRYTTAIEQLSNDKASIRLGGVYTLVGLVDEWLADEIAIPNIEERRKEGQVIINNLCAYIRSPFLLAERAVQLDEPYAKDLQNDFDGDKEKFDADKRSFTQEKSALEEERQIRQSIIKEMREHLHNDEGLVHWSYFDYDFSNAYFFYFTDFTRSHFDGSLNFTGAEFTEADFSGAEFTQNADFSKAEFTKANFFRAEFTKANFFRAEFTEADFSGAEFTQNADFSKAEFTKVSFSGAEFTQNAHFTGAKFTQNAHFSGAEFTEANFFRAEFTKANFSGAEFTQNAHFTGAKFTQSANFYEAKFTRPADFSETTFQSKPIFTLDNLDNKARFSCKAAPEDYKFKVSSESPYKIETEEQEHNGVKFIIPKGAELFDPDDPSS